MKYRLLLAGAYLLNSVSGAPVAPATENIFHQQASATLAPRDVGDDCFDVDAGIPGNMHWNDRDQFVLVDGQKCRPKLGLREGSCRHHQDLSTKCTAFCQTSAFHFFAEPIPLMGGKMCREGEGCEIRHEHSFHVEVSNTEVMRHVIDATASITPSVSWGFGFDIQNVTTGLVRRDGTPVQAGDDVAASVRTAMEAQDGEMAALYGNASVVVAAAANLTTLLTIPIPVPTITSPTASIAMTFAGHWTRDWTHTYHHSEDKASFTAITHKQVPGEGCGAFWAVPVAVGYCGWSTSPRFPPAVHADAMQWLHASEDPYEGAVKMGRWGDDATHQQWNVTDGRCPVNYHEFPFCYASPLTKPGIDGRPDEALQRTVWRPYDCETARLLPSQLQPREVRQQLDFDEFFKYHIRQDPRLFNPELAWSPSAHQEDDQYYDVDRVADYGRDDALGAEDEDEEDRPVIGFDDEDDDIVADYDKDDTDDEDGIVEVEVQVEGEDHVVDVDVEAEEDHVVGEDDYE